MVLRPCARPPKPPMVLLYMVQEVFVNGFKTVQGLQNNPLFQEGPAQFQEGLAHGFKTMYGGDVVMLFPNKTQNNKKYYMSTINNIKN